MPLDTELIDFDAAPPFEAGASFFARLAFPLPSERTVRQLAFSALVRWAFVWKSEDPPWADQPVLVRPRHFALEDIDHDDLMQRLLDVFDERILVARYITLPLLKERPSWLSDGLPLIFSNLVSNALGELGWGSGSEKTFADSMWRPARPVAHAATAFSLYSRERFVLESIFDAMTDKILLKEIILASEMLRLEYASGQLYKKYKLRDGDTVQFRILGC